MTHLADSPVFLAAETWLATSGRLLLRVAAMLFMAYLVTLAGTLAASALAGTRPSAGRSSRGDRASRSRGRQAAASAPVRGRREAVGASVRGRQETVGAPAQAGLASQVKANLT